MDEETVNFEDFGVAPDCGEDATEAWNRLLVRLDRIESSGKSAKIVFRPGRYDFFPDKAAERPCYVSNHTQTGKKKICLLLENRRNATVDGCGSEFFFHGVEIPVALVDSKNCVLKNFSIDFQYPQTHQLRVRAVDKAKNGIIAEVCSDEPYRIENGKDIVFTGEENSNFRFNSIMLFDEDGKLCYNLPDQIFNPRKIVELEPRLLEISGWRSDLRPGIFLALRVSPRPAPGIFLYRADNARIESVTVRYAFGMGLLAQLTENIALDGFKVCRRGPDDPRRFTTHADATHFSQCKGLILSENGVYEGMNDDAINAHGVYLKVLERRGEREVRAAYMHRECWGWEWGRAGDLAQFIRSKTMESVEPPCHIESIRAVDAQTYEGAKVFDMAVDRPLTGIPFESEAFGIENLSWTPEVVFRNNVVRNNRARGALFSTPRRVICEDNVFDHVHGSAILLCGDCNGWFETGACHDVVIRRNRIINNLTAYYQFTKAVLSLCPEIPDLASQKRFFHSNVSICDNVFEMFDAPLLYAKSVEHLRFSGNKIRFNNEFQAFHENKRAFLFEHVSDVVIEGNDFDGKPELESDVEIRLSKPLTI